VAIVLLLLLLEMEFSRRIGGHHRGSFNSFHYKGLRRRRWGSSVHQGECSLVIFLGHGWGWCYGMIERRNISQRVSWEVLDQNGELLDCFFPFLVFFHLKLLKKSRSPTLPTTLEPFLNLRISKTKFESDFSLQQRRRVFRVVHKQPLKDSNLLDCERIPSFVRTPIFSVSKPEANLITREANLLRCLSNS